MELFKIISLDPVMVSGPPGSRGATKRGGKIIKNNYISVLN
jgi:hypothetical protein